MPRYKLRTLMIVLAIGPPLLWIAWEKHQAWKTEKARQAAPIPRRLTLRTIQIVNGESGLVEWTIDTPIQPDSSGPIPSYRFREP